MADDPAQQAEALQQLGYGRAAAVPVTVISSPLGSLGDRVWLDQNANRIQDAGELGLAGVTVNLSGDFDGDGIADYVPSATTRGIPAACQEVS